MTRLDFFINLWLLIPAHAGHTVTLASSVTGGRVIVCSCGERMNLDILV